MSYLSRNPQEQGPGNGEGEFRIGLLLNSVGPLWHWLRGYRVPGVEQKEIQRGCDQTISGDLCEDLPGLRNALYELRQQLIPEMKDRTAHQQTEEAWVWVGSQK